MADIVERLAGPFIAEPAAQRVMDEAIAEIERLREWNAEIALNAREFAEALKEIADFDTDEDISNEECMRDIARAALEGDRNA